MQAEFVNQVLIGLRPTAAAAAAGYSNPVVDGSRLIHSPSVMAALHEGVQQSLQQDAPQNLVVLRKIRDDEKAPARVRADIGVKLLQLAGHVAPSTKDDKPQKALADMSQAELLDHIQRNQEAIDKAEAELMAKAKDVSPARSVAVGVQKQDGEGAKPLNYLD